MEGGPAACCSLRPSPFISRPPSQRRGKIKCQHVLSNISRIDLHLRGGPSSWFCACFYPLSPPASRPGRVHAKAGPQRFPEHPTFPRENQTCVLLLFPKQSHVSDLGSIYYLPEGCSWLLARHTVGYALRFISVLQAQLLRAPSISQGHPAVYLTALIAPRKRVFNLSGFSLLR